MHFLTTFVTAINNHKNEIWANDSQVQEFFLKKLTSLICRTIAYFSLIIIRN